MPINLSVCPNCNNKALKLLIILLVFPVFFYGQTLTGLWTGAISNDSTTVRKDQSFEIALTEYKGKVYGYSRSEFIVDNVLYYVVKRVKGTIEGDVCEVIDDEIIAFNFPTKLDKGVKVTSTFRRNKANNVWQLEGTWKTNATKKYYAVTGKVDLEEEKDLTASKIFPHLEELKLASDIAFYKEREEGIPVVKIAKPERTRSSYKEIDEQITQHTGTMAVNKPVLINTEIVNEELSSITKSTDVFPKTNTSVIHGQDNTVAAKSQANIQKPALNKVNSESEGKEIATATIAEEKINVTTTQQEESITKKEIPIEKTNNTVAKNTLVQKSEKPTAQPQTSTIATKPVSQPVAATKRTENPVVKKEVVTQTKPPVITENKTAANITASAKPETKSETTAPAALTPKKTIEEIIKPAAVISGRKSAFTQEVNYKSDSLVLSLYDNGEIDGDTVSVFLNGEIIMAKQGLKATAIHKTIYISPDSEDFSLVLFAENLGKYPPNTGLLVVHDGEDVYNLRFSSDFQKNSGIVFRRKK